MTKRVVSMILCMLAAMAVLALPVSADMGPKPSVRITFENMGGELCYGTLLSKYDSTGPSSAWDGNEAHIYNYNLDMEIWEAFVRYEDADGYYFLQEGWLVSETGQLNWTYYPPSPFKVLLYYPESNTYLVSGIYERYAFDSYFTVDMAETGEAVLTLTKSYDYTWELVSLLCRIIATILLEIAVALLFGFRDKNVLLAITGINAATQIILNVLLNVILYTAGGGFWFVVFYYIPLELLVFVIEAVAYALVLNRVSKSEWKIWTWTLVAYSFVANAVSFIAGLVIAGIVPGIF